MATTKTVRNPANPYTKEMEQLGYESVITGKPRKTEVEVLANLPEKDLRRMIDEEAITRSDLAISMERKELDRWAASKPDRKVLRRIARNLRDTR